ncbi:MAG: arginine N-succinyltransferase [Chlamydiia bacterium]|nr:arginine N-succinyltransferase [Chlamydiia bacterium]
MRIIRPATLDDLDAMEKFALTMTYGVTSLPKSRQKLEQKLKESQEAFSAEKNFPHSLSYFFLLEDLKTGKKLGTCQLLPAVGNSIPLWVYKVEPGEHPLLRPHQICDGPTELRGLFLLPEARRGHLGKMLSWSRFLFLASFPGRFQPKVMAQMRGIIDSTGQSPFWNAVGKKLTGMPLTEGLKIYSIEGTPPKELLTEYPLYIQLLPKKGQECIGRTHKNTAPALKMLLANGFKKIPYIDPVDGGPTLEAKASEIRSITQTVYAKLARIAEPKSGSLQLIANGRLSWRCTAAAVDLEEKGACLSQETADALQLAIGDPIVLTALELYS